MRVTRNQLIAIIAKSNATTIKMSSATPVKMNKRGNSLADAVVLKEQIATYKFNKDYEQLVRDASNNDNFTSQSLRWGHWLSNDTINKVIEHKDELYLRYYNIINCIKCDYSVNGHSATDEEFDTIAQFSKSSARKMSKTQESAGVAEEDVVVCSVINIKNIKSITIDNVQYELA